MQIDDILLLRMNRQYLFVPAEDELTVLRDLCGLQAQFYGNCLHALRLRCGKAPGEDILRTSAVKMWTLRGTLHLIALDDLPLFLYDGRNHFLRPCDTMSDDDRLSAARKRELAAIILDAAKKGCGDRKELRLLCREHGMTPDEEQNAFDPWGGLLRALCESGTLGHTAQQKKAFRPCPPFAPMTKAAALRALMRRYLTHYGPVTVQDAAYFFGLPQRELLPVIDRTSLMLAKEYGCESIAFPLISSGIFGYPKDQALKVAIDTISSFLLENEMTVYIVIFDRKAYQISGKLFADIAAYIDDRYVD